MKNKYIKDTNLSERKFREVLKCFAHDVPVLTTAKLCGLNYRTAHRICELLRQRVVALALAECAALGGEVEVDESYFGPRRVRGKRGRGAAGKIPVIGLHKRGENVYVSVVKNCSKQELMPIITGRVLEGTDIYTDGWKAYDGLVLKGYEHHRIHHHENQFARGKNHVNGIESFWSYAKFRFLKLRGVRKDRFLLHLKECEWRFNHRRSNLYPLLLSILRSYPLLST
jgi:transposase-like protein